jgi:outer membrane murein-binding lipoprotein Lpp
MKNVCVLMVLVFAVGCGKSDDHSEKITELESQLRDSNAKIEQLEKQITQTAKAAGEWDKKVLTDSHDKIMLAIKKLREEDKDNLEMVKGAMEAQQKLLLQTSKQVTQNTKQLAGK